MEDTLGKFKSSSEHVVEQHIGDEKISVDTTIASLRNMSVATKEQQIELQAKIAYLSLFSDSTSFTVEAEQLIKLTDGNDIEQMNAQVQVILHLANNAKIAETDMVKVASKNRDIVDNLCNSNSDFGLRRRIDDIQSLSNSFYRWKMSLACYSLIRDKPNHDIARHIAMVPVIMDSDQRCIFVQKSSVSVLVANWLTCELEQKGIDMNALLK